MPEVNVQEIEKQSNELIVKAQDFSIATNDQYIAAMEFAKTIKAMMKEIESTFDPIVKKAHAAWKEAIAQKNKHLEPLEKGLKLLDNKGRTFRAEQEHIRQEEQRKSQELADKEAERLRRLAERAEARGDEKKKEAFAAKAEEVAAIVPVVAPKVSAVEGIKVRKVWKYEIINENKIPREYLMPDTTKIGSVVRDTKGTLPIKGVRIYSEDSSI